MYSATDVAFEPGALDARQHRVVVDLRLYLGLDLPERRGDIEFAADAETRRSSHPTGERPRSRNRASSARISRSSSICSSSPTRRR